MSYTLKFFIGCSIRSLLFYSVIFQSCKFQSPFQITNTAFAVNAAVGINMLQHATRLMVDTIPSDRWRDVTVRVTSSAVEMFRGAVSCRRDFVIQDHRRTIITIA